MVQRLTPNPAPPLGFQPFSKVDTMTREATIALAVDYFETQQFHADLARRVAIPTESQNAERAPELIDYLTNELSPTLTAMGFTCQVHPSPVGKTPFFMATRIEDPALTTVLSYGHGDVVRGLDAQWREGLAPWKLTIEGERIYGRGTADNKGQHTINLGALQSVLKTRGKLGFNLKLLYETGEEIGSPGLNQFCAEHKAELKADVFIASDGPRLSPARATLFLGSRGVMNFDLTVQLRDGAHHSGNWGGLIRSRHHPRPRAGQHHRCTWHDTRTRVAASGHPCQRARGTRRLRARWW